MKDYIWKCRIALGFSFVLLIQVPFVCVKLKTADQDTVQAFMEVAQLVTTSGLVGYMFSQAFTLLLQKWLYGRLRKNWKEVRVLYSDGPGRGAGAAYPREPTLLVHPPLYGDFGRRSAQRAPEDPLFAQRQDGSRQFITSPSVNRPMSIEFNSGHVGQPGANEDTWDTGTWSELQLMEVGPPGYRLVRVGFPDTVVTLGKASPDDGQR